MSERTQNFGRQIKLWRQQNNIKQTALAEMLGVSQTAISLWENGHDQPSGPMMTRVRDLISRTQRDEYALERLFTQRQSGVLSLVDYDGARLLAVSQGFRALWPQVAQMEGLAMANHLVDEAQHLFCDADLRHAILSGSLGLASGVSERQTDLPFDPVLRHGWHICFRRHGYRTVLAMSYEICTGPAEPGITDLIHLDALG